MLRRDFLKNCGLLSAGTLLAGCETFKSSGQVADSNELSKHKIDRVKFGRLKYHFPRLVGKNARKGLNSRLTQDGHIRLFGQNTD